MNEDALDRRLGALKRSAAPAEDLWPRIEEAIDAGERGSSPGDRLPRAITVWKRLPAPAWAGLGLAACLAAAALILAPRLLVPANPDSRRGADLRRELREAERDYAAARTRLLDSLRAVSDESGQETVSRIESDMRSIDRLVAELRKTAGDDAGDWQPVYRLVEIYRSQAAGIARADELVRSVSYREETR